jgi:hypothetical protein
MLQHTTDRKRTLSGSGQKSRGKKFFFGIKTAGPKLKSKIGFLDFGFGRSHLAEKNEKLPGQLFPTKNASPKFFFR